MSYTYPEALRALEAIANDYIKVMRPAEITRVTLICDPAARTASVEWDVYGIRITMPVRPAVSVMTQAEFEDWTAFLLHELGHPTHTDQAIWFQACKSGHAKLLNALEDVRMERAVIASNIVPNARKVLSRLVSRKVTEARASKWNPNARREFGWTICVLGRVENGYAIDASDVSWIMGQIRPYGTVQAILTWALPALAACADTAACYALAQRIAVALAAPIPQGNQPTTEEGEGEAGEAGEGEGEAGEGEAGEAGEGEGEAGEGEGEAGEAGDEAGEAGEAGEADEGKAPQKPSNEAGEGDSAAGKGGQGHGDGSIDNDEAPVTSEKDLETRELAPDGGEHIKNSAERHTEKRVLDILRGGVMDQKPRQRKATPDTYAANAGERLRENAAQASRQRALIARALRSNETDEREGGRRSGRLDKRALTRAVSGSSNVFARREISEGFDTDVCVLLDASGSMAGNSLYKALEAGLVIAQAAGSVGAPCTTEIFNSSGYRRAGVLASKRPPVAAEYGALVDVATGGTPLCDHIARAALDQARRAPNMRRVVFVVTDGECDHGPATLKRMVKYLEQACGVVLAHVSIGRPLDGAFRAEVCVPHGVPVAEVGLDHFVRVLQAL